MPVITLPDGSEKQFDQAITVMDELEELDEVAYVRFASVYRSFRNVNQFMHELRSLLERHPGESPREDSDG